MADWESLSKQLKSLGVQLGKETVFKTNKQKHNPIEKVLNGYFFESAYGQVFCHEELYPQDHQHGNQPLFLGHPIDRLCQWAHTDHLTPANLQNIIFLDTETSGLAGGTGTYAFEVGVGRFTHEGFRLAQFFMRHPGEEPALLAGLYSFVQGMQAVVTYNGKAFDIPLLNTRYALTGFSSPFEDVNHFDLLPLARRLWSNRLKSRTLGNVEAKILGVTRNENEVPGYLIPEMYFEYLRTGDARPLVDVFYHNAVDILSLTGLFNHMAFLLQEPHSELISHAEDTAALARLFESIGNRTQAAALYQKAVNKNLPEPLFWDALYRYSFLLKRASLWEEALALWEQAANANKLYAFEELAKYYEHHAKDLEAAFNWTERALTKLEEQSLPSLQYQAWKVSLDHRLNRIKRKSSLK